MSENLKTIKELADELGVSKQTIHYHIKSLSNIKRDKNNKGAVLLNEEEQKFIYSKVNAVKDNTVKDNTVKDDTVKDNTVKDNTVKDNTVKDDTVKDDTVKDNTVKDNTVKDDTVKDDTVKDDTAHFLSEIQFLRTQLENKDTQILQMQNLLDQQQRLALQDKNLLEEYKVENDRLKALKIPSQETKEELVDNQSQEVTNVVEATTKVPRKWWQFWR
ncbi:HTH domain-containing protein [Lactococcus lactis]|uniref:HTH domain-containing protein n=1 Tax=Lactococcus lactis TaxID=1358 RepID=UPI003D0C12AB